MPELRKRLIAYEKKNNTKVICDTSGYKCSACLKIVFVRCKKLEKYLETGKWK